jgi:acyl carrier protein
MQIEALVHSKIRAVLDGRSTERRTIRGIDKLNATLGLSSLDLAFIVAELEAELDADPFAELVPITSVISVDNLVEAYRRALFPDATVNERDDHLVAAVQRAQTRRARKARR